MNRMNKYMLYIAAAALLLAAVFAAPVSADSTQKEEVLYVNLNTDGSVEDVYAVNIFTMPAGGLITDYGSYSSVKNLITTDGITQNGDEYSLNVGPGKIYYQGNMGTAALPWDISFRYYLNGNQVSAESLSNASGHVEIVMSIAQNPAVDEYFFKNFALMASMTLDAAKCQNITADGATIANVGGNKQLSFTIMPNKTSEFTISTDAVNFRMDAVSINGVRLMMDIDVDIDDTKEDFRDLEDGAVELDDGVQNLTDGVKNLSDGVWELEIGAGSLSSGLSQIAANNKMLQDGGKNVSAGVITLVNTSLNQVLNPMGIIIDLTEDNYPDIFNNLLNAPLDPATKQKIHDLANLTGGAVQLKNGVIGYTTNVAKAASGASSLSSGTNDLYAGVEELKDGVRDLKNGTRDLRDNTTGMDTKLQDKIDEMLQPLTGGDGVLKSFTSPKNTNIQSVQFVMHTKAIELPEKEAPAAEVKEDLNLFQRILRLFGLY